MRPKPGRRSKYRTCDANGLDHQNHDYPEAELSLDQPPAGMNALQNPRRRLEPNRHFR
jgi:hypothetical protein